MIDGKISFIMVRKVFVGFDLLSTFCKIHTGEKLTVVYTIGLFHAQTRLRYFVELLNVKLISIVGNTFGQRIDVSRKFNFSFSR